MRVLTAGFSPAGVKLHGRDAAVVLVELNTHLILESPAEEAEADAVVIGALEHTAARAPDLDDPVRPSGRLVAHTAVEAGG